MFTPTPLAVVGRPRAPGPGTAAVLGPGRSDALRFVLCACQTTGVAARLDPCRADDVGESQRRAPPRATSPTDSTR
ncbi:hypothetical protein FHR81_003442 [Actinoalloteichus hoggarensis]|uniref:Uncharacterized protein n=1 Tax=Actinoalloteichus hoggarensis TaxID=1470176 RepID=A0A221W7W1_9PSEU|nr:hypothetical protein AHOG_20880 [Actinoalloteichus hoggarensis]MBB5922390.1 hypothetical protein [Actinoalloteichus hoggarensis]